MTDPGTFSAANKWAMNFGLGAVFALAFLWIGYTVLQELVATVQKVAAQNEQLMEQHGNIADRFDGLTNATNEGNRIACAACWNAATSEDEIKRCNCSPAK